MYFSPLRRVPIPALTNRQQVLPSQQHPPDSDTLHRCRPLQRMICTARTEGNRVSYQNVVEIAEPIEMSRSCGDITPMTTAKNLSLAWMSRLTAGAGNTGESLLQVAEPSRLRYWKRTEFSMSPCPTTRGLWMRETAANCGNTSGRLRVAPTSAIEWVLDFWLV